MYKILFMVYMRKFTATHLQFPQSYLHLDCLGEGDVDDEEYGDHYDNMGGDHWDGDQLHRVY